MFEVKDSGQRIDYPSGMRRDVQDDKPDYTLIHLPFLTRIAWHLTKGAKKYGRHNWKLANSAAELERFKASAMRHLVQWLEGNRDEDHASAVVFNLMAAEYVMERIRHMEEKLQEDKDVSLIPEQIVEDYLRGCG